MYIPKEYAKDVHIETVSGDINFSDLQIENGKFTTISGKIDGSAMKVKKGSFESTSSDIHIDNFVGELGVESTAGDLSINVKILEDNISVSSTSGDVKIKLPKSSQFYLESETVSGDIQCEFPLIVEGEMNRDELIGSTKNSKEIQKKIQVETTSGDIEISKK